MKSFRAAMLLGVLVALSGCMSRTAIGTDGSIHPDATKNLSDYTGQGRGGEGSIGDSSGEGGPSADAVSGRGTQR